MTITSFKDLRAWQISMDIVIEVYKLAWQLPRNETYGLASQMQRAAISIPSNIAEVSKRGSRADFRQFCRIALGSAAELETQLLLTKQLYPHVVVVDNLLLHVETVQKMLGPLAKKLQPYSSPTKNDTL